MKKLLSMALAAAAVAACGQFSQAAVKGTLDIQLIPSIVQEGGVDSGLRNVDVQIRTTGTDTTSGGGGLSDLQFAILTSGGLANALPLAAAPPPQALKNKITWADVVTTNFTTVNGNKTDSNGDGGLDGVGNAFFDPNNFKKSDLGVGSFVTIATLQFRLTGNAAAPITITPSNIQYYDYVTGEGNGFRSTFATINSPGVTLPGVPEPTTLGLLGMGVLGLVARRRQA